MKREWTEIDEYPKYIVSNHGEFVNMRTDREIRYSRTRQGHAKVALYQGKELHTRSAALIVARTFVPRDSEAYDTPIHLDGDLMNCRADNLMWRPRWYAIRYHQQFMDEEFRTDNIRRVCLDTDEEFDNAVDLCAAYGVLYHDVKQSCLHRSFVQLLYLEFRSVK